MKRSESITNLAGALAKAQMTMEHAKREHTARIKSQKADYTYNYASLDSVLDVCRESLTVNGLSIVQMPSVAIVDGRVLVSVTTTLFHESGEWIESDPLTVQVPDSLPQTVGSGITYARRYGLSPIIGVAFETDDDGQRASGIEGGETAAREYLPNCPQCGKPDKRRGGSVYAGKPDRGGGLYCWKKEGVSQGCGHSWQTAEHPFTDKRANDPAHQPRTTAPPVQVPEETMQRIERSVGNVAKMADELGSMMEKSKAEHAEKVQQRLVPGQEGYLQQEAVSVERNAQAMAQHAPPTTQAQPANGHGDPIQALRDDLKKRIGVKTVGEANAIIRWASSGQCGCLEDVQHKKGMAEQILRDLQGWTMDRIKEELRSEQPAPLS